MTAAQPPDAAGPAPASPVAGGAGSTYCDTGPIVAAVMGPGDPFFDDAMRFFKAAELGGVRLIASSLTLSEAVDVIRKRTKASRRCTDDGGGECKGVDAAAAAAAVDKLVDFIDELKARNRVDIPEEKVAARPDFARLHGKTLEHGGRTPQARKGDTYRHEWIGPIDWIHIALARLAGARAICTTDRAMGQIAGDKMYGDIEVVALRPR